MGFVLCLADLFRASFCCFPQLVWIKRSVVRRLSEWKQIRQTGTYVQSHLSISCRFVNCHVLCDDSVMRWGDRGRYIYLAGRPRGVSIVCRSPKARDAVLSTHRFRYAVHSQPVPEHPFGPPPTESHASRSHFQAFAEQLLDSIGASDFSDSFHCQRDEYVRPDKAKDAEASGCDWMLSRVETILLNLPTITSSSNLLPDDPRR
jgi:hypothetical protein